MFRNFRQAEILLKMFYFTHTMTMRKHIVQVLIPKKIEKSKLAEIRFSLRILNIHILMILCQFR